MAEPDTQEAKPEVSVLIVSYRSTELLQDCLDALTASTIASALQVIVVDNASPDFDVARLRERFPRVLFLPQSRNTTFTGGNDIAFAHASGRFVLMLNPDTRVEPEAIERAVKHMDTDPGLAALGAYLLDASGDLQRYYRRLPRLRDVPVVLVPRILDWTPLGRRYRMADASFEESVAVEQPPGAFILVRRSDCPDPILDADYFNFFSDVELCRSLLTAGEIRVEPDVRCFHVRGGAGLITYEPKARSRLHQDVVWGLRRYFRRVGTAGRAWIELWVLVFWGIRLAQSMLRGRRDMSATWAAARASVGNVAPDYSSDGTMER